MADTLVVVSRIKKMMREAGLRSSAEVIAKLNQMVEEKLKAAVEKAKQAGKKTLQAVDLE